MFWNTVTIDQIEADLLLCPSACPEDWDCFKSQYCTLSKECFSSTYTFYSFNPCSKTQNPFCTFILLPAGSCPGLLEFWESSVLCCCWLRCIQREECWKLSLWFQIPQQSAVQSHLPGRLLQLLQVLYQISLREKIPRHSKTQCNYEIQMTKQKALFGTGLITCLLSMNTSPEELEAPVYSFSW